MKECKIVLRCKLSVETWTLSKWTDGILDMKNTILEVKKSFDKLKLGLAEEKRSDLEDNKKTISTQK